MTTPDPAALLSCPYVIAGPWTDDNGVTCVEIQIVGGHEMVAEIYADKAETATRMAEQAIAAWNRRATPPDHWMGASEPDEADQIARLQRGQKFLCNMLREIEREVDLASAGDVTVAHHNIRAFCHAGLGNDQDAETASAPITSVEPTETDQATAYKSLLAEAQAAGFATVGEWIAAKDAEIAALEYGIDNFCSRSPRCAALGEARP